MSEISHQFSCFWDVSRRIQVRCTVFVVWTAHVRYYGMFKHFTNPLVSSALTWRSELNKESLSTFSVCCSTLSLVAVDVHSSYLSPSDSGHFKFLQQDFWTIPVYYRDAARSFQERYAELCVRQVALIHWLWPRPDILNAAPYAVYMTLRPLSTCCDRRL